MRRVVVSDDLRELEIWPSESFDRYRKLAEKEIRRLSNDKNNLIDVSCPACCSDEKEQGFNKFGLDYVECLNCKTLYISPRIRQELINQHFAKSEAIEFWRSHVVKESLEDRIGHLFKPRAIWVSNLTEQYFEKPSVFVDVNSMYNEFLDEIDKLNLFKDKIAIDPLTEINEGVKAIEGFKVIKQPLADVDSKKVNANVVTAFSVIDHVFSPEAFINAARSILVDDGILFFTVRTISGFDLQVLWENSEAIFPPDHINLLSIEGIVELVNRSGFEIIELSTPGQLDVELVINSMDNNKDLEIPRFISYFLKNRDKNAHRYFQELLQQLKLSSHARVAVRKKK